jgi:hypothetical protein
LLGLFWKQFPRRTWSQSNWHLNKMSKTG